jgi:hypothetical protein
MGKDKKDKKRFFFEKAKAGKNGGGLGGQY